MALKLFEIVAQFMMNTFLLKLTQFEKTGSVGEAFNLLGNLIINFNFGNEKSITFSIIIQILLFDSGVCLPFNNKNALSLKEYTSQIAKNQN